MAPPMEERTPPMTPQLALRVAIVGGVALVMFAVIFLRLWFLQVLSGSRYIAQAQENVVRDIPVAAPRGELVDINGNPLVKSVLVPAIVVAPESLPVPYSLNSANFPSQPHEDYVLYDKVAKILGISTRPGPCQFYVYYANSAPHKFTHRLAPIACDVAKGVAASQYANITVKTNVSTNIQDYIGERQAQFPGVLSQEVSIRRYPLGRAGAQVFGPLAAITSTEVGTKHFSGIPSGGIVGQSGLEYEYNQYLQGVNGEERVKVNSNNQFEGYLKNKAPQAGDTLKLSLDGKLEQVGQRALAQSIALHNGTGGAFVAMDPQNGQIYGMGSAPSYNPSAVSPTISPSEWRYLNNPNNNSPLINRAIDGALPDGSTFKPITAVAALESGNWTLADTFDDVTKFCFAGGLCLQNSGGAHYGLLDLQSAFEVSDDEFFYNLGDRMGFNPYLHPNGGPLQIWARKLGISRPTGVDLPGESAGEMGTPRLLTRLWRQERQCENATGPYKGHPRHPAVISQGTVMSGGCGIAASKYWSIGDNVNTGVGQFDDEVTPMQLAVVYAAIENGGTIVTPHIADSILSAAGTTLVQRIDPAPRRRLNINSSYLAAIQEGLRLAASGPNGTSTNVMGNFPEPVYGKTGTAELGNSASSLDHSWYACYVPASATTKPIVVVVDIEKGGFGDVAAAPVARQILSQWFLGKPGPLVQGSPPAGSNPF